MIRLVSALATSSTKSDLTIQIWGFEDIKGERRYVRKVYLTNGEGKKLEKRLVYDFSTWATVDT